MPPLAEYDSARRFAVALLKAEGWRIVKLSAQPVVLSTGTKLYEVEDEL